MLWGGGIWFHSGFMLRALQARCVSAVQASEGSAVDWRRFFFQFMLYGPANLFFFWTETRCSEVFTKISGFMSLSLRSCVYLLLNTCPNSSLPRCLPDGIAAKAQILILLRSPVFFKYLVSTCRCHFSKEFNKIRLGGVVLVFLLDELYFEFLWMRWCIFCKVTNS